ncbi:response regulator [Actinoallomurus rhizosphaericola]|uniref:response regulator n=1 Tax=Actinoallomurus rhizosphaericola TaxID=2952536 RepID=UPI002091DA60|nr:response regulator transcription factor [Actinoallomurus rhizosphaericola]MCO5992009.1 response regulator transcription factor [Actinoallomurus rhizosphaericola]
MTASAPISVLIADDQALVRAGLVALVGAQADLTVVAEAADGAEAVARAREVHPDVVLMDIRMPVLDGLAATRRILTGSPGPAPRVVVLTTYDLDEYVYEALCAGACGFLLKHAPPEELLLGVRAAAGGGALISPGVTGPLIEAFTGRRRARARPPAALARLTAREREVFDLVVEGRTNTEIARTLSIAETTVKTHLGRVLDKLGLRDRVHAVMYAYENALVPPGTRR